MTEVHRSNMDEITCLELIAQLLRTWKANIAEECTHDAAEQRAETIERPQSSRIILAITVRQMEDLLGIARCHVVAHPKTRNASCSLADDLEEILFSEQNKSSDVSRMIDELKATLLLEQKKSDDASRMINELKAALLLEQKKSDDARRRNKGIKKMLIDARIRIGVLETKSDDASHRIDEVEKKLDDASREIRELKKMPGMDQDRLWRMETEVYNLADSGALAQLNSNKLSDLEKSMKVVMERLGFGSGNPNL
jgi:hypothetical protein